MPLICFPSLSSYVILEREAPREEGRTEKHKNGQLNNLQQASTQHPPPVTTTAANKLQLTPSLAFGKPPVTMHHAWSVAPIQP